MKEKKWDGHIDIDEGRICAICNGPIYGYNWTESTGQLTHKNCEEGLDYEPPEE